MLRGYETAMSAVLSHTNHDTLGKEESWDIKQLPSMEKLIEWLPENVPEAFPSAIVHGDYRLDNIIFHPTENRVVAVLDWELSTLGDPMVCHVGRVVMVGLIDAQSGML